jgi:hypothetical protein
MRAVSWPIVALVCAISVWIRLAFPIYAIGSSPHDDQLFLELADDMVRGNWLGQYDNLTHAKGAAFSAFVAVNYLLGLPLKLSEFILYLLCSLYLSIQLGARLRSRKAGTMVFVLLRSLSLGGGPAPARRHALCRSARVSPGEGRVGHCDRTTDSRFLISYRLLEDSCSRYSRRPSPRVSIRSSAGCGSTARTPPRSWSGG